MKVAFLLVTCCLEQSRNDILKQVVDNLEWEDPNSTSYVTVFDNASTVPETTELLSRFTNVFRAERNVGYWTAIDWWLDSMKDNPPDYTYIIESDMIHYDFKAIPGCVEFLDKHPEIGSMRLHEYSVENRHLYNKDAPVQGSRSNLWQSHTNKVTGRPVEHEHVEGPFWATNFLTQLPALNRYDTMKRVFDKLHAARSFTELDFQTLYHHERQLISIIDGGIFNCDLNPYGTKVVTGSWTDPKELAKLGYVATRQATIDPRGQYVVTKLDR